MAGIKGWLPGIAVALALMAGSALADDAPAQGDTTKGDAARGAQVFASNACGFCHESGGKTAGRGPKLMGTARDDAFITFRIQHGKEALMPAFGATLTPEQILDLIAYIRSLKDSSTQ
jgi:mono/diheme cytochrome c family protein